MNATQSDTDVSLYENTLKFHFVQIGDGASEEIKFAREKLSENVGEHNIVDTNSRECARYLGNVTKKDVFVLSEFAGEIFEKLCATNALVVGPQCVITCFMENESVPNNKSPVFTMAMRNLIITLSAFSLAEKRELKKLIGFMGGRCIDQFTENITHLVTNRVDSKKYEQAAIQHKVIMKSDWVKDIWTKSATENVLATDQMFDRHRLPVLYNLSFTTTGLKEKLKMHVKRIIEENGGKYFGEFSTTKIDILLLDKTPKESPKWKAAISSKKDCLTYEWVRESVSAGFALPLERFRVQPPSKPTASTPERILRGSAPNFECTNASNMSNVSFANTLNETNVSMASAVSRKSPDAVATSSPLHRITLQEAKMAGLFLDGCNIYACGFAADEKEKVWKILNFGGATRFDSINSSVSHILVGNPSKAEETMLQTVENDAHMLTLGWLVECIAKKCAITEYEPYLYRLPNAAKPCDKIDDTSSAPSPASKRNILSMSGNSKQANPRRLTFQNNEEVDKATASMIPDASIPINENMENLILDQYMNASVNKGKSMFKMPAPVADAPKDAPEQSVCQRSDESAEFEESSAEPSRSEYNFLEDKIVFIHGFNEESHAALVSDCELGGATVIADHNYKHVVDYMILPIDILTMDGITVKAKSIVNHYWLLNAKALNKPTDIPYFYKPIFFSEELKPLAGLIVVFSTYASDERTFLGQLAEILGAEVQDSYRKVARPLLICPTAENRKYEAAIKWHLPVVSCEWLLACYKYGKRLPVKNHLVGDSISPVDDVPDTELVPLELEPEPQLVESVIEDVPPHMAGEAPLNPRVASLRPPSSNRRPISSPSTSAAAAQGDMDDLGSFNASEREHIQDVLDDALDTPETKRRRWEEEEMRTPEYARTPVLREQRRQWLEDRRNRYKPTQNERTKKKSTPWTEYKRRFWKEALGDAYESPSQCYTANTQGFSQVNSTAVGSERHPTYDTSVATADLEADANIRKLNAFIKNRDNGPDLSDSIPDSAPQMQEMDLPNTELPEIVGWGDRPSSTGDRMRFRGTPYFSVSLSNNESARVQVLEHIRRLNGRLCENLLNYDKTCSHLLCERPNRGEKTCCSIASGKWVLSTEYVFKSIQAGRFLDEELFEWGNPKAAKNLPQLTEQEEPFAKAAYRLRVQMENKGVGVFSHIVAIVRTLKDENMRNLIEAGHGKVLTDNKSKPLAIQKDILQAATHLIVQPKVANLTADDIKVIKKMHIICVNVNYLNACITTDQLPLDPKPFLHKI